LPVRIKVPIRANFGGPKNSPQIISTISNTESRFSSPVPADSDALSDPGMPWTGAGIVALGRLSVTTLAAPTACDGLEFVPVILPPGISASDDSILRSRAAAYAVSLKRRQDRE